MRYALATSLVVLFLVAPVCWVSAAPAKAPTPEYGELLETAGKCLQTGSWTAFQKDLDVRTAAAFQEKGSAVSFAGYAQKFLASRPRDTNWTP